MNYQEEELGKVGNDSKMHVRAAEICKGILGFDSRTTVHVSAVYLEQIPLQWAFQYFPQTKQLNHRVTKCVSSVTWEQQWNYSLPWPRFTPALLCVWHAEKQEGQGRKKSDTQNISLSQDPALKHDAEGWPRISTLIHRDHTQAGQPSPDNSAHQIRELP